MVQVENHPNLMKSNSGLVVDVDKSGYVKYMAQKKSTSKINELESTVDDMKQSIEEIKILLNILINTSNRTQ